jgi:exosortase
MLKSEKERPASNELADIYIIEPRAIEHIPTEGFFDIKEGLIAALVHAGRTVRTAQLSRATGAFGERDEYLRAMSGYVRDQWNGQMNMCGRSVNRAGHPLISGSAVIDPSARLYGPVVIMSDVRVQAGAIVFGPTVMESGVTVGEDSLVENSVLWTGAAVGRRCEIRNCIVDRRVAVAAGSHIADAGITDKARNVEEHSGVVGGEAGILSRVTSHPTPRSEATGAPCSRIKRFAPAAGFNLLLGGLVWAYWPVLSGVWRVWRTSAEYSAGIIVPFLAVFIIWTRRKEFRRTAVGPSMWGLVGFAFSQAVMILGTFFMYDSVQRISFILAAASLVLLLFGRQVLRETSPVLLFACLMFPLPRCVHDSILMPAQKFSVISAEFCLQSMGVFATRAGNTLKVEESALAIGTGCDGLRMVTAFMVVAALAALLIRRSRWEKLLVFVSSVPIAMLCNTIRITLTAAGAKIFTQGAEWHGALHTAVGFAMIPLAAAGVIAELWLVSKLAPVSGKLPVNCKVSVIWEST